MFALIAQHFHKVQVLLLALFAPFNLSLQLGGALSHPALQLGILGLKLALQRPDRQLGMDARQPVSCRSVGRRI